MLSCRAKSRHLMMISDRRVTSSLNFVVAFIALSRLLPTQFRLDKHVDVAVHHGLYVACFRSGSVIFHHLIRLKNVGTNLAAPGDVALFSVLPVDFGAFFVLLDLVK